MRKLILATLILAVTATAADARRRHHRHHYLQARAGDADDAGCRRGVRAGERGRIDSPAQFVPRDWQLMPPDPNWQGRRYMAPDGDAWLAFYATNAANDASGALQGRRLRGRRGGDLSARRARPAHRVGPEGRPHLLSQGDARLRRHGLAPRRDGVSGGGESAISTASSSACRAASSRSPTMRCGDNLFSSPQPVNAQPKADEKPNRSRTRSRPRRTEAPRLFLRRRDRRVVLAGALQRVGDEAARLHLLDEARR